MRDVRWISTSLRPHQLRPRRPSWHDDRPCDAHAGTHARLHDPPGGRCRVRWRYVVHAGCRICSRRHAGGDARTLYRSIQRILALPGEMRLFMRNDYGPNGPHIRWETTVADEIEHNSHVGRGNSEDAFVTLSEARDATLAIPNLIIRRGEPACSHGYQRARGKPNIAPRQERVRRLITREQAA